MKNNLKPVILTGLIFVLYIVLICVTVTFAASAPVIYYSDLASGPKTGGQDNKGVFVTISGKNFGAAKGTSLVSVGAGQADNYPVWTDTKITFQLGTSATTGSIKVTTPTGTSNAVPFSVRPGKIYFVSANSPNNPGTGTYTNPWRSPNSFYANMAPGDTCYIRAGIYTEAYGRETATDTSIAFDSDCPVGTSSNPISWIGYPGEIAVFHIADTAGEDRRNIIWNTPREYYITIAGFTFENAQNKPAIQSYGSHINFINNKVNGGYAALQSGVIHICCSSAYYKIYGNELFGDMTKNKQTHIIYITDGGASGVDIGWNWFHDNKIGQGPIISLHQDDSQIVCQEINIHDNMFDCRNSEDSGGQTCLRAILYGHIDRTSTSNIYNNIFINAGGDSFNEFSGIQQMSGSVNYYNNTFYGTTGYSLIKLYTYNSYAPTAAVIKNNIFYSNKGIIYINIRDELNFGRPVIIDNNCYYGNGKGPSRDTNAVNADPKFVNASGNNFHLQANSPAIKMGAYASDLNNNKEK